MAVPAFGADVPAYSQKPIRIIVPFPAGGPSDMQARLIGSKLGEAWSQTVVVDNRGGAAGIIGTELAAPAEPDLPTVAEAGVPGYQASNWYGFAAPDKTPRAIVGRLSEGFARMLAAPAVRDRLHNVGMEPATTTPAQFTDFVKSEIVKWACVVRAAGVRAD